MEYRFNWLETHP